MSSSTKNNLMRIPSVAMAYIHTFRSLLRQMAVVPMTFTPKLTTSSSIEKMFTIIRDKPMKDKVIKRAIRTTNRKKTDRKFPE